jgi:hypothetical protein
MGTWRWWLKPLVTGVDLEFKEVSSDDGMLEGVVVGPGSGRSSLEPLRHHRGSGGAAHLSDASEKIFSSAPRLTDRGIDLLKEEWRPSRLLWHLAL